MTDPIRAALERLLAVVKPKYTDPDEIMAVVRAIAAAHAALLADGPAVPEGREPASVVGEPSDRELRELVGRLGWIAAQVADIGWSDDSDTIARAATLLQQFSAPTPVAVPVAVEALARLYWWGGLSGEYGYSADVALGVRDWINGGMAGSLPPLPVWVADRCPSLPFPASTLTRKTHEHH